jgi:hypothetical protein
MKKARLSTLLVGAGLAAAAFAPSALADTGSSVSSNWSGYRAATQDGTGFSRVSGSWTEPSANCSTSSGHASFWVGLGGSGGGNGALEQAGTAVDCDSGGNATHTAWYELLPDPPVQLDLKVSAGDQMSSTVTVDGSSVTITVSNATTGQSVTKNLTMTDTDPDVSTAEWIAEAPSQCDGSGNCQPLTLADFGKVGFTNSTATAGGHTGTISDSSWTAQPVTLSPGGGVTEVVGGGESGGAQPSDLSTGGASFSVSYVGSSSVTATSGNGYGSGSGYGQDPSGGYGYDPGAGGYGYDPGASGYGSGGYGSGGYGSGGYGVVPGGVIVIVPAAAAALLSQY